LTLRDLRKQFSPGKYGTESISKIIQQDQQSDILVDKLQGKPFYIWNVEKHKKRYKETCGECCFNHCISLPVKQSTGKEMPLFPYEKMIYDLLEKDGYKLLYILKAAGLGISEFFLRYASWLCLRDNKLSNSQMCIITGPRINLAIDLISRMKKLFLPKLNVTFDTKETVLYLNSCRIEAFPSHHLDAMRGLPNVSFIMLDEGDFVPKNQQQDARDVSERYIGKSNPTIAFVSTANSPSGLFENIKNEPENTCIYKRLYLDYTVGEGFIYSSDELERAKLSPSFEREYNLKFLGMIGNIFHTSDIDAAIDRGRRSYTPPENINQINLSSPKILAVDPGFGSSALGLIMASLSDGQIQILEAEEYNHKSYEDALSIISDLIYRRYGKSITKIYADASNPAFLKSIKRLISEEEEYADIIADCRKSQRNYEHQMIAVPVSFSEGKSLLANAKLLIEKGKVSIHPKFDKLIVSLRTACELGDGKLDKQNTAHDDIFDAFLLAMRFFYLRSINTRTDADVYSFEMNRRFSLNQSASRPF
jgi:hypothetical protein